jgi:hypothetical protein
MERFEANFEILLLTLLDGMGMIRTCYLCQSHLGFEMRGTTFFPNSALVKLRPSAFQLEHMGSMDFESVLKKQLLHQKSFRELHKLQMEQNQELRRLYMERLAEEWYQKKKGSKHHN